MKKRCLLRSLTSLGCSAGLAGCGLSRGGVAVVPREAAVTEAELRHTIAEVALTAMNDAEPAALAWNWGEGVLVLGLWRAALLTGDRRLRDYLEAYYSFHEQRGIQVRWSDDTTPAIALTERLLNGELGGFGLAKQVVDYVRAAPRSRQGMLLHLGNTRLPLVKGIFPDVWVDSIFHVVPTQLRFAELTARPMLRDAALVELVLFAKHLQDPQTGLIAHGFEDERAPLWGASEPQVPAFSSGKFWARGNGWMLATLADALMWLPGAHPQRSVLVAATVRLGRALRRVQAPSGLFHTLLTDEETYLEAAGSALILYGLHLATTLGHLEKSPETTPRDRAALLSMLKREGRRVTVGGTSLGTNPVEWLYALTPTADQVSYGVGAWLMAATEMTAGWPSSLRTGP